MTLKMKNTHNYKRTEMDTNVLNIKCVLVSRCLYLLSNTETELKQSLLIKKAFSATLEWCNIKQSNIKQCNMKIPNNAATNIAKLKKNGTSNSAILKAASLIVVHC